MKSFVQKHGKLLISVAVALMVAAALSNFIGSTFVNSNFSLANNF